MYIYHITTPQEWQQSLPKGEYLPAAYAHDGFIHCSKKEQVAATANRHYPGQTGLILLEIDVSRLSVPVKEENLSAGAEFFPHIYGAVPVAAVTGTAPLLCDPLRGFLFPERFSAKE
jgi:uncharacterized protein (DUF952 family)